MNPFDVLALVRKILAMVLDLVEPDVARRLLDEEAIKRANAAADIAEAAKFGRR